MNHKIISKFAGKFITFEGVDGVGKSTQSKMLAHKFSSEGLDVVLTREPGGSLGAEIIRNVILENSFSKTAELLLFMAARADHVENMITPSLRQNKVVVCDRFLDSTIVYQGINGFQKSLILDMHNKLVKIMPSITIILTMDIEECKKRLIARQENNSYDERIFEQLESIQEAFIKNAKNKRHYIIVDALGNETAVHENILNKICELYA